MKSKINESQWIQGCSSHLSWTSPPHPSQHSPVQSPHHTLHGRFSHYEIRETNSIYLIVFLKQYIYTKIIHSHVTLQTGESHFFLKCLNLLFFLIFNKKTANLKLNLEKAIFGTLGMFDHRHQNHSINF